MARRVVQIPPAECWDLHLSNGEVWHSVDHGDTWHQLPFRLGGIHRTLLLLPEKKGGHP